MDFYTSQFAKEKNSSFITTKLNEKYQKHTIWGLDISKRN